MNYGRPVAWKLRQWLMQFLAGRYPVAMNLTIRGGTLELQRPGACLIWRCEFHGGPSDGPAITVKGCQL